MVPRVLCLLPSAVITAWLSTLSTSKPICFIRAVDMTEHAAPVSNIAQ
ncbi:hypothetical protein AYI69_g10534, partial [Smittium culicis]